MKWYFPYFTSNNSMLATTVHIGITKTHRFTTWSDVFNIPSELRLIRPYHTGNRKNVLPPRMFCFSAIKTRNSTLKFVFLLFCFFFLFLVPRALPQTGSKSCFFYTWKFKLLQYIYACKYMGVFFLFLYFVQERVPRVIPFRLSKTNQADHMCLGAPSFDPRVYA